MRQCVLFNQSQSNKNGKCIKGSKILILGVAFKKNIDDARNSPSLKVMEILSSKGADVIYNDPHIPVIGNGGEFFSSKSKMKKMKSTELTSELLNSVDCTVILVDHEKFNIRYIINNSNLIIDAKNYTKGIKTKKTQIVKL